MPDSSDTQANDNVEGRQKKYVLDPGIKRILITGAILFLVLLTGTFFLRTGRIPFFTQNFLGLVVLIVVGIQAYIYSGQWHAMRDSLEAIREQINVGRQQAEWMRMQGQTMANQVGAMINQTELMMLSLEETRKIVGQNERTIQTTEKSVEVAEKTSIYAQRAYVTAKIRDIGEGDDTLQFRLRIENGGNTPANNVMVIFQQRP